MLKTCSGQGGFLPEPIRMSRQEHQTLFHTVRFDVVGFFHVDSNMTLHTAAAMTSARVSILSSYIPQQSSFAFWFVCGCLRQGLAM